MNTHSTATAVNGLSKNRSSAGHFVFGGILLLMLLVTLGMAWLYWFWP